jgi:hypothetical protein
LAVDGSSWDVQDADAEAKLDPDALDALWSVLEAAPASARGRSLMRPTGSGRWSRSSFGSDWKTAAPKLIVELTQDELATILSGSMDRAVYTRCQRAVAAGVAPPVSFSDPRRFAAVLDAGTAWREGWRRFCVGSGSGCVGRGGCVGSADQTDERRDLSAGRRHHRR